MKQWLIQMLHDYVEIFAWSYEDMPGLDTDIVVHHLPTKEECPPGKTEGPPYASRDVRENQS